MTVLDAQRILQEVADSHGYRAEQLCSHGKSKSLINAKIEATGRIYDEAGLSTPEIADLMGLDCHTSVCHRLRKWKQGKGND